ncbi:MAG: cytochrome c biogenesis protein ResB, partial [Planctomycetia bacterium]
PNSGVVRVGPVAPNPATAGLGRTWLASAKPPEGGASSRPNIASAYVQLRRRTDGSDLGTFLVSQFLNDQAQLFMGAAADETDTVDVDATPYRIQLRYRRQYKPYAVTLTDVRRINYGASETPRDYSSYVTFTDAATKAKQDGRIWMNNPVRYRGETFYQSQYAPVDLPDGTRSEMTGLQIVENAGWLIPYVACVLALWGMLAHFGGTFLRFADRYDRERIGTADDDAAADGPPVRRPVAATRRAARNRSVLEPRTAGGGGGFIVPAAALCLGAVCCLAALRGSSRGDGRNWQAAAALPVLHEGRIKPLDSVARNTLQLLGNRTSVSMPKPDDLPAAARSSSMPSGKVTAAQWLLSLMAGADWVEHAPVFRIDAKEVKDLFDLPARKGHRYSHAELEPGLPKLRSQLEAMRELAPEQHDFSQKKFAEINQKLMAYDVVRYAYETPRLPEAGAGEEGRTEMLREMERIMQMARRIQAAHPPAALPPPPTGNREATGDDGAREWQALYPAWVNAIVGRLLSS